VVFVSNLDDHPVPVLSEDGPDCVARPVRQSLAAREARVGGQTLRRLLPHRERRLVGAWCFLDHYGPTDVSATAGMGVGAHPHMGLQTVTWLFDGDVLHHDSLGNQQMVRPGQLNLMTAGDGIAHAEVSPTPHLPTLHGVQLWIALPDEHRHTQPAFDHYPVMPVVDLDGFRATVLVGQLDGIESPATVYSPLSGFEFIAAKHGAESTVALDPGFEYAAVVVDGSVTVDGYDLRPGQLLYLGSGRHHLPMLAEGNGRLLLLGGQPFGEDIIMWWNFVGRTAEDMDRARDDWQAGRHFQEVPGFGGSQRIPAPPIPPGRLKPRR
jgi:redox-sensitive bicupin YhaK (pirin superfamily)